MSLQRWGAPGPTPSPFVETSVSSLIRQVLDNSQHFGMNALITGVPGIGKSRVIAELVELSEERELLPRLAAIEVTPTAGMAVLSLLDELAEAVGVGSARSVADLERKLRKSRPWRDMASTIIFDEAQNLSLKAARILLGISEHAGYRMIFIGNPEVLKLVNSQLGAIQQVSRRLPIRETIEGITEDDADQLASALGCEGMDAFHLVREIAEVGHADGVVTVLQAAKKIAGSEQASTIRRPHVVSALELFPQFRGAQRRPRQLSK